MLKSNETRQAALGLLSQGLFLCANLYSRHQRPVNSKIPPENNSGIHPKRLDFPSRLADDILYRTRISSGRGLPELRPLWYLLSRRPAHRRCDVSSCSALALQQASLVLLWPLPLYHLLSAIKYWDTLLIIIGISPRSALVKSFPDRPRTVRIPLIIPTVPAMIYLRPSVPSLSIYPY